MAGSIICQHPGTHQGGDKTNLTASSQTIVADIEEELVAGIRLGGGEDEGFCDDDSTNRQLASPSLFVCRNELYRRLQEIDFWTWTIVWRATSSMQVIYRLVVGISKAPNGREVQLLRLKSGREQKFLNPAKTQSIPSSVVQPNQIWGMTKELHFKMQKLLPREVLIKPSSTIKLDQVEIPDCATIQGSIIPCVTDIETGKISTKGHFIVQLKGRALREFSQNHRIMKFQVGVMVAGKTSGEVVPSSSPDSSASSFEKMESFSIRNKKGQMRCLIDLICHDDLLRISQPEINVDIMYSIACQYN